MFLLPLGGQTPVTAGLKCSRPPKKRAELIYNGLLVEVTRMTETSVSVTDGKQASNTIGELLLYVWNSTMFEGRLNFIGKSMVRST